MYQFYLQFENKNKSDILNEWVAVIFHSLLKVKVVTNQNPVLSYVQLKKITVKCIQAHIRINIKITLKLSF